MDDSFLTRFMWNDRAKNMLRLTVVIMVLLAATACGRRGPLEPPPGAAPVSQQSAPTAGQEAAPEKPKRTIFLDRLL